MVENLRSSNKKKFDQELAMILRSITGLLTEDTNNKIDIQIKKSLLDKVKLDDELKTCCNFSRYSCISKNLFDAFYADYIDYKNYTNDITFIQAY